MDYVEQKDIDQYKDKKNEVEIVDKITSDFIAVYNRWQPYYRRALLSYDMLMGKGLREEVYERMEAEHRPNESLNFLRPLMNTVSGMIYGNKLSIKANPLRRGDEKSAAFRTVLVSDYAMGLCNGYREAAKSHGDAAICGMGWTSNYWDNNLRRWITKAYDPFMGMNDPDAISYSDDDSRYRFISAYYSVDDILKIFDLDPEVSDEIKKRAKDTEGTTGNVYSSKWAQRIFGGAADSIRDAKNYTTLLNSMVDLKNGIYRVVEFHDKRLIDVGYLFHPQSQEMFSVPEEVSTNPQKKSELLQAYPKEQGWIYGNDKREEIWTIATCPTLSPNKTLVNHKHPIQGYGFQHKPTYWYADHPDKTETRGILDNLLSLNDYYSKLTMTRMDAILRGVFPDVTYEDGAIKTEDMADWKSKEVGKMKKHQPGKKKPEREKIMGEVINSIGNLSNEFFELRHELSGIPKASMGFQDSSKETGVLYRQKVQMSAIGMETVNDHIRQNMESTFNYCSEGLRVFMTEPEEVRILSEPPEGLEGADIDQTTQDSYWLKINWETVNGKLNDVSAGSYDFRADTSQLGQTGKMAVFAQNMDLLKITAQIDPMAAKAMLPIILEGSDAPDGKQLAAAVREIVQMEMGIKQNAAQKQILGSDMAMAQAGEQLNAPQEQPQLPQKAGGQNATQKR